MPETLCNSDPSSHSAAAWGNSTDNGKSGEEYAKAQGTVRGEGEGIHGWFGASESWGRT